MTSHICIGVPLVAFLSVGFVSLFGQSDNGLPASRASEFRQKEGTTTSTNWRTYENTKTGDNVSFNPKTSEVWFNPATKKFEAVLREDGSPDPNENSVKTSGPQSNYQKTEKWFNPVTKKFENVITEVAPTPAGNTPQLAYPQNLDNGLPIKTAMNWKQLDTSTSSTDWRTYENTKTGQVVSFNPRTSELWYNPVIEKWEPVVRETTQQTAYIKSVARQYIYKNKPTNATKWICNRYSTVHNDPSECQDPDSGGVWIQ